MGSRVGLVALVCACTTARAQIAVELSGELELELVDIEGEGGPGFDSVTDTRTLGTRSPTVRLDTARVVVRARHVAGLGGALSVDLRPRGLYVGVATIDFERWGQRLWAGLDRPLPSAGRNHPLPSADRRTERYPLIAAAYWREPGLAAGWSGRFGAFEVGTSVGIRRPLDLSPVSEAPASGTLNVVGYGQARSFSGNGPVVGGYLGLSAHGVTALGFGFVGPLSAEGGTDVLRSALPRYRDLPPAAEGTPAWWAGGRFGYDGFGVHVLVEAIASAEDRLSRVGTWAQLAYRVPVRDGAWMPWLLPLVRWERTWMNGADVLRGHAPAHAAGWEWRIWTLALIAEVYRELLRVRVEYALVAESHSLPNDELLMHLEVRF